MCACAHIQVSVTAIEISKDGKRYEVYTFVAKKKLHLRQRSCASHDRLARITGSGE
jgi:hypothetical protein